MPKLGEMDAGFERVLLEEQVARVQLNKIVAGVNGGTFGDIHLCDAAADLGDDLDRFGCVEVRMDQDDVGPDSADTEQGGKNRKLSRGATTKRSRFVFHGDR